MPSTSDKQHNFMEAIAHDKKFAQKAGVPQSVGQDFADADKTAGKFKHEKSSVHMKAMYGGKHDKK